MPSKFLCVLKLSCWSWRLTALQKAVACYPATAQGELCITSESCLSESCLLFANMENKMWGVQASLPCKEQHISQGAEQGLPLAGRSWRKLMSLRPKHPPGLSATGSTSPPFVWWELCLFGSFPASHSLVEQSSSPVHLIHFLTLLCLMGRW